MTTDQRRITVGLFTTEYVRDTVRFVMDCDQIRAELVRLGWTPPAEQLCCDDYELGTESGQEYIRCKACGLKSFHPEDIKHRYCGNCRTFLGKA